jgi:hypothetical protein
LLNRPAGYAYTDWVALRIDGSFVLRPLLHGERRCDLPAPGVGGRTDARTLCEFTSGDWRFRLSPAFLLARIIQLRGVQPYQLVRPDSVSANARLFENNDGSPIYSSRGHHPFVQCTPSSRCASRPQDAGPRERYARPLRPSGRPSQEGG